MIFDLTKVLKFSEHRDVLPALSNLRLYCTDRGMDPDIQNYSNAGGTFPPAVYALFEEAMRMESSRS
jgi:hypothetical protein